MMEMSPISHIKGRELSWKNNCAIAENCCAIEVKVVSLQEIWCHQWNYHVTNKNSLP